MSAILTPDNAIDHLKVPPHSLDAEQWVLGGVMRSPEAWDKVSGILVEADFYRHDHRWLWRAMAVLSERDEPLDVITVSEYFNTQKNVPENLGLAYLGTLVKDTPTAANIEAHAKIVREKSLLRQLITLGSEIAELAFNPSANGESSAEHVNSVVEHAANGIFSLEIAKEHGKESFTSMKSALKTKLAQMEEASKQTEMTLLGKAGAIAGVNDKYKGLENKKVYLVAARPAMGKTTYMVNDVENIALEGGLCAVFSLEMPAVDLVEKMMASQGRADYGKIRAPYKLSETDWAHVGQGVQKLQGMDVFIDDSSILTPSDIRSRARRLVRDQGRKLDVIAIDYVQLMSDTQKHFNRESEISAISRQVRAIAKDFDCPVILLSQLNRSLENRPNKRPIMSDLRESGALEQDATGITFIYRDEVYDEDSHDKGIAELIIAKNRGGETGTVRATFSGKHQRFDNYAPDVYTPEAYQ